MTTILACLRERVIVADSKCTNGQLTFRTPKVFLVGKNLVGVAGESPATEQFVEWLKKRKKGRTPDADPGSILALMLTKDKILLYSGFAPPMEVSEDYYAVGSGDIAAMAVIKMQQKAQMVVDPVLAVEIATEVDINSGPPVVVFELPQKRKRS